MKKDSKTYLHDLAEKEYAFDKTEYCNASGQFKVIFKTYDEAFHEKRKQTVPLRIYHCKGTGHYHFTHKLND